jgi:hypothetical protein
MISKQECEMILGMLAAGRISAEEAEGLFDALERCSLAEMENSVAAQDPFHDWAASLGEEISQAVLAGVQGFDKLPLFLSFTGLK